MKNNFLRSSNDVKENSINLTYNLRHIVYCIEYFRNQLIKIDYLFSSLTSFVSSTLDNLVIKSFNTTDLQFTPIDTQNNGDIKKSYFILALFCF